MSTQSNFLQLTLPLNNEYQNTWDQPMNANLEKIDAFCQAVNQELVDARSGQTSLADFLAVAHSADGTLKPTDEVVGARNSFVYGDQNPASGTLFQLGDRLNRGDREVFDAREGNPTLRDSLAFRSFYSSQIVSGTRDANGYATWMGHTGANVQIDGSVTPIRMLIDGFGCRIRGLQSVPISGPAGTVYVWASYAVDGVVRIDGDSTNPPPVVPTGTTGSDGTQITLFQDLAVDFTTQDVQAGDILTILGSSIVAGQYQIAAVAPNGNKNQLKIIGVFPGALSALDYQVNDPASPELGFDVTRHPGKFYIGEADWDGSAITSVRALHFRETFVGEWRSVDVSGANPTFAQSWYHNLFDDALDVTVQVSQANDGSAPIEQLSMSELASTLGLTINDGKLFNPGTWNPGTGDASYNPLPDLQGTVTGALNGSVTPVRSCAARWTNKEINIKNIVNGAFYTDYTGTTRLTGYIRVIIQKRRI